jgi:phage shock protein A
MTVHKGAEDGKAHREKKARLALLKELVMLARRALQDPIQFSNTGRGKRETLGEPERPAE